MTDSIELQKAVERMHHCSARLAEAVLVSETFGGDVVWEGIVHVFQLTGHPSASMALHGHPRSREAINADSLLCCVSLQ
jgi:hypothetical protein